MELSQGTLVFDDAGIRLRGRFRDHLVVPWRQVTRVDPLSAGRLQVFTELDVGLFSVPGNSFELRERLKGRLPGVSFDSEPPEPWWIGIAPARVFPVTYTSDAGHPPSRADEQRSRVKGALEVEPAGLLWHGARLQPGTGPGGGGYGVRIPWTAIANLEVGQVQGGDQQDGAPGAEVRVVGAEDLHNYERLPDGSSSYVFVVSEPNGLLSHRFLTAEALTPLAALYEAFHTSPASPSYPPARL